MTMRQVLLINKDDSFNVISMKKYIEYQRGLDTKVVKEIFRESFTMFPEPKYCVFDMDPSASQSRIRYWVNLSEFPDEIKALLVLYEI